MPVGGPPGAPGVQWGPATVENFDALDESRWFVYDYQDRRPRRDRDLVDVADGVLRLRGAALDGGLDFGSGISDNRFHQSYGRWEARFRVSPGAGFGVAVLLWPENGRWPADGEVDLVEVNSVDRQRAIHSIHNGPSNRNLTRGVSRDFTTWHTVAVEWLPDRVTYYIDGDVTWTVVDPSYIPSAGPLHLTIQLDECAPSQYGGFIPCRNPADPAEVLLEIDWVRVYEPPADVVPS